LIGRQGSGTTVATLPGGVGRGRPGAVGATPPPGHAGPTPTPAAEVLPYDFRTGLPDLASFPRKLWGRFLQQALTDMPDLSLGYGPIQGSPHLRSVLEGHLRQVRGIRTTAGEIVVTTGSTQALHLLAELLISPGTPVAVENPSHFAARLAFERRGARLLPVPVDGEGMVVAQIPEAPRVIYVTPSHQFPCGSVLSLTRRTALVHLARQTGAVIIEDDYDSEIRHSGSPLPALQGLAPDAVAYIGSLSKLMAPTLRLGFAVLPHAMVGPFVQAKQLADYHSPGVEQEALARFIGGGHLERHLGQARRVYRSRRRALVEAVGRAFGSRARLQGDATGLHVWLTLASRWTGSHLAQAAREAGVGVYPLESYWHGECQLDGCHIILGYGHLAEPAITQGIRLLAEVEATAGGEWE